MIEKIIVYEIKIKYHGKLFTLADICGAEKMSVIFKKYDSRIWQGKDKIYARKFEKIPANDAKNPKTIKNGTAGKTKIFATGETHERFPKFPIIMGKVKICAAKVPETIFTASLKFSFVKILIILEKTGSKNIKPKTAIKESWNPAS